MYPGKIFTVQGNVWMPMQDYKSAHAAVMICATLVNTHTDTQLLTNCAISSAAELKTTAIISYIIAQCLVSHWSLHFKGSLVLDFQ